MRKLTVFAVVLASVGLSGCVGVAEGLVGLADALEAQNAQQYEANSLNLPASYWEGSSTTSASRSGGCPYGEATSSGSSSGNGTSSSAVCPQ